MPKEVCDKVPKQICEDKPKEVTKTVCNSKHIDKPAQTQPQQYGPPEVVTSTVKNMITDKYPAPPSDALPPPPSYPPPPTYPDSRPLEHPQQPQDHQSKEHPSKGNTFCK